MEIRRRLAEAEPAAYLPDLARSLWGYAWICNATGIDLPAGLSAAEEAISYYRRLSSELPEAFRNPLAAAQGTAAEIRAKLTPTTRQDGIGDLGRNAPCHCGSDKKYKRCHGATLDAIPAPDGETHP